METQTDRENEYKNNNNNHISYLEITTCDFQIHTSFVDKLKERNADRHTYIDTYIQRDT